MKKKQKVSHDAQLLNVREVCKLFGVSMNFIYRHIDELPKYRLGSRVKFSADELLNYWKQQSLAK